MLKSFESDRKRVLNAEEDRRILELYDHAHNSSVDNNRYNPLSMAKTVISAMKRLKGFTV